MPARKKTSTRSSTGSKKKAPTRKASARKKPPPKKAKKASRPARRKRVKRTAAKQPTVVYIHGIGDQPPRDELKHRWDLALFGSDRGDATRMAYWADLTRPPAKAGSKRTRSASSRARALDSRALLEEAEVEPTREALVFAEALAARLAGSEAPASGTRGRVRTKVLPLPGFLRRPIAEKLLRWLVKDTAAYFFDPAMRAAIQERLLEQIPTGSDPYVLVAHSQGTIASFEVLSDLDAPPVALFVTLGSPLGMREVQDLLEDRGRQLVVPPTVRSWHNFADRLDPVAVDANLDSDFGGWLRIRDQQVINERTKELLRLNPHSSVGYLANLAVRTVVHHAISFDTHGRFVVARDVAEEFAGEEVRSPILIEALHPGYPALGESRADTEEREAAQKGLSEIPERIDDLANHVRRMLRERAKAAGQDPKRILEAARVQSLRKYVAARLTPDEIAWLAREHARLNVYAVWRSSRKSKVLYRSAGPIKVDAARNSYESLGRGIVWAVLDTGARFDHPHFAPTPEGFEGDEDIPPRWQNSVIEVLNCTTADPEPVPITDPGKADLDGHGTHVAGVIAGRYKNKFGRVDSIAPEARLVVYKVLDDDGFGEDAWIIKAIDDIYRRNNAGTGLKIHGVNLSLGGPFDATVYGCGHSPICTDLRDLWRQGVLVCVAAGNEGQVRVLTQGGQFDLNTQLSIGDPANLEDCIAVGSVNADKPHLHGISYFSSRGPTADGRAKPDVVAPGERILSANSAFGGGEEGHYKKLYRHDSGTSMACPHVSGMLAAFLSVRWEFRGRPDEVKKILMENCNDLGRDVYHQGAGMPNLMKMLLNT